MHEILDTIMYSCSLVWCVSKCYVNAWSMQVDLLIPHRLQGIAIQSHVTDNMNRYVKTLVIDYSTGDPLLWQPYMDSNGTSQQVCTPG